ncbi:MAG: hypothetical protein JZU65_20635 [Chlorobium sp.]|nr:hypothetical protein [Chlorobium sp.]
MTVTTEKNDVQAFFREAPKEIQDIVLGVIDIEHQNIHYKRPPKIKEEIIDLVRGVIK